MLHKKPLLLAGALCAMTLSLGACSGKDDKGGNRAAQVGFVVVREEAVPITTALGGRTVAFETSEVRPQVNGIVRQRLFTEGAAVRAGQPLFQIDASLYKAAVDQAAANLASARASAQAAEEKAKRFEPLAKMQAVAEQDYTDALAQARVARAAVAQSAASLETARINLRYSTITAPIGGHIGRSLVTPGALVSASQATPLAVIQRTDPMYVDIQQSAADMTRLRQSLASGGVTAGSTNVRLKLEDGSDYGLPGTVQFSEVTVNEATGTVTLRARFPNPSGLRKVEADRTVGANWVVTGGLKPGDRVITQGVGNLKQGSAIKPVPATSPQRVGAPAGKSADKSAATKGQ